MDEYSYDILSFNKGDGKIPPPSICKPINTKKSDQTKTKKLAKNAPNFTSAFKVFYTKYLVAKYDINGDDILFIHKMNMKKSIIPISRDALDIESRLEDLFETYEEEIKAAGNYKMKDNDEDDFMNEIENLGFELNENRDLLN